MPWLILLFLFNGSVSFAGETVTPKGETPAKTADPKPLCVDSKDRLAEIKSTLENNSKNNHKYDGYRTALRMDADSELLARLIYAETLAANCPADAENIAPLIAAVIGNRIRLRTPKGSSPLSPPAHGDTPVKSVVFERDQFASSLNNYSESRQADFICPYPSKSWNPKLWRKCLDLARAEIQSAVPTFRTSPQTVHYFLYQHSPRWNKEPWKLADDNVSPGTTYCIRLFKNSNWK